MALLTSLFPACILVVAFVSFEPSHAYSKLQAFFAFGDSFVDFGNNNILNTVAKANFPPYGVDFQGNKSTGRFFNGRNLPDFIASAVKLNVPAYRLFRGANITSFSANFASGASGILPAPPQLGQVLQLKVQVNDFLELKTFLVSKYGNSLTSKIMENSLFYLTTGNNDINNYFSGTNKSAPLPRNLTDQLVAEYKTQLKRLYSLGARRIALTSTEAVGCFPVNQVRDRQCDPLIQSGTRKYNRAIKQMLKELSLLPELKLTYCNLFKNFKVVENPKQYGRDFLTVKFDLCFLLLAGFLNSSTACCSTSMQSGGLGCVSGGTFCSNRDEFLFWDGVHPTEKLVRMNFEDFFYGKGCFPYSIQKLTSM